ncbi:MAG: hypothetical protein JNM62_11510 [Flavobacteriales bacterium]|nr:hypothetical protein [Flavobacteriales bacterium]
MLKHLITLTIVLLSRNSSAQIHDTAPLNETFHGAVLFKIDKQDRLVMDLMEDGIRFRQDIVRLSDLDPDALSYAEEEDGIALKCRTDRAQCISKEIFKLDVVRITSRVTIPRPHDDTDGQHAVALLRDLIATAMKANDESNAETPAPGERKNARKEP